MLSNIDKKYITKKSNMKKKTISLLLFIVLLSLSQSLDFKWDKTTTYAHFYNIDQTRATKNTKDTIRYQLTSNQVPKGVSKVTFRINTYGDPASLSAHTLMFGLITEDNKNKMAIYWDQYSLLLQSVYGRDFGFGTLCLESQCQTYSQQVFLPANKTAQLTIDTNQLSAQFFIPKNGKTYYYDLSNRGWENKKLYYFFQSTHMGGEIEVS